MRSNGTVTYVGKDIAYQLWKFGLLGKDFHYKPLRTYADGHVVWVATDEPYDGAAPQFGRGTEVYNVIDSRQSYLQDVVVAGLRALGLRRVRPTSRFTFPTRWWRSRRAPARNWRFHCPRRISRSRM